MTDIQKKTMDEQREKLKKAESSSSFFGYAELQNKLLENLERSIDSCKYQCDSENFFIHNKGLISEKSMLCLERCVSKRHKMLYSAYNVR